ncbi:MAG: hypothetical protein ACKN82_21275 [Pirellula sp.]
MLLNLGANDPGYKRQLDAWFGSGVWIWDHRVLQWRADAYHYRAIRSVLASTPTGIIDQVPPIDSTSPSVVVCFSSENKLPTLRPEQQQALDAWSTTRNGVVVMPLVHQIPNRCDD